MQAEELAGSSVKGGVVDEMPDSAVGLIPDHLETSFDPADLKKRSVHGSLASIVVQGIRFAAKFTSTVVLARLLTPAEFGLVAMVTPILGFVGTFNDLGFGQAIIQRRDISKRQLSSLFWINITISVGLAALLAIAAPIVGWIYKEPRTTWLIMAMGSLLLIATTGIVPSALLRRKLNFIPVAIADLGNVITGVVVTIAAALMGFSYWSLVLGQAAASLTGAILASSFARWWPSRPARHPEVKNIVRFGANLTGVNIATYFSMTADNMIVGVFAGKVALGLYDRSYNLTVQPLNQLLSPISGVAVPLLSRLQSTPERYRRSYLSMLQLALLTTMPAMLVCVVLAKPVILLLLGQRWHAAPPIFAWICFGGLLAPVFSSTGWVFTTQNRTHRQMILSIVTALISIASFAIGIAWGAVGVAAASAISFTFIQVPFMIRSMVQQGPISLADMARSLTPFVVSCACVAVPLYYLRNVQSIAGLAGAALLSYSLFALCILLLPGGRKLFATVKGLFSTLRAGGDPQLGTPETA